MYVFIYVFYLFVKPLSKSRGDHWKQALIFNDVESTEEQGDQQ